jgi:hypothetical protein
MMFPKTIGHAKGQVSRKVRIPIGDRKAVGLQRGYIGKGISDEHPSRQCGRLPFRVLPDLDALAK